MEKITTSKEFVSKMLDLFKEGIENIASIGSLFGCDSLVVEFHQNITHDQIVNLIELVKKELKINNNTIVSLEKYRGDGFIASLTCNKYQIDIV